MEAHDDLGTAALWALLGSKLYYAWGYHTMVTDLPKYMSSVLKFSIQANGFLSALPYVLKWFIGNGSSWIADWLIKWDKISRTNVRKIFNTISPIGPTIFIISASYSGCDCTVVVILFVIGVGMMGSNYSSLMVNSNDLSLNYSGTLMASTTGIGSLAAIVALYVAGLLAPDRFETAKHCNNVRFGFGLSNHQNKTQADHTTIDDQSDVGQFRGKLLNWNDLNFRGATQIKLGDRDEIPFLDTSA